MDINLVTRMTRRLIVVMTVTSVLLLLSVGIGPQTGKYRVMTMLTGSMRPTFPEGSLVVQTPLPVRHIKVGDVITYGIPVDDRRVVTHRVIEIVEPGQFPVVRTQGDANNSHDPWLARLEGDSTWKVRAAVPKAGYLLQWLRQPVAQRLTQFVIPALLALLWLRHIWRRPPAPEDNAHVPGAPAGRPGFRTPLRSASALAAIAAPVPLEHRATRARARLAGRPRSRGSVPEPVRTSARRRWLIAVAVCAVVVAGSTRSASAAFADGASDGHTVSTAQLAPPTGPGTSAGTCTVDVGDSIVVTWTASTTAWADGYEILRSTSVDGPYTVVASAGGAETESYTDSPLPFFTTYYYVIQSMKGDWRSSATTATSRSTRTTSCT